MYRVLLPVGGDVEHVLSAADAVISLPNATTEVEAEILNVYEGFEASGEGGRVDSEDVWNEENYPDSVGVVEDRLTGRRLPCLSGASTATRRKRSSASPRNSMSTTSP